MSEVTEKGLLAVKVKYESKIAKATEQLAVDKLVLEHIDLLLRRIRKK